jgi:uncharacterized protein (UPF0332 family)
VTAQQVLSRHRLGRARAALQEAAVLQSAGHWHGALNRVYYAAFYAARALLALKKVDSSRHSGVIALFQQHFVQPGVVAADVARALPQAFARRQRSDYDDFTEIGGDEIQPLREQVQRLVDACEEAVTRFETATPGETP